MAQGSNTGQRSRTLGVAGNLTEKQPSVPTGIECVLQMMKTGKLYLIKQNGPVCRTVIIVDQPFDLEERLGQEETDNDESVWFADIQGIPEC